MSFCSALDILNCIRLDHHCCLYVYINFTLLQFILFVRSCMKFVLKGISSSFSLFMEVKPIWDFLKSSVMTFYILPVYLQEKFPDQYWKVAKLAKKKLWKSRSFLLIISWYWSLVATFSIAVYLCTLPSTAISFQASRLPDFNYFNIQKWILIDWC